MTRWCGPIAVVLGLCLAMPVWADEADGKAKSKYKAKDEKKKGPMAGPKKTKGPAPAATCLPDWQASRPTILAGSRS